MPQHVAIAQRVHRNTEGDKLVKTFVRSAIVGAALATVTCLAFAQDVQERVIKFGHLNNTDHPVSMGV